MLYPGFIGSSRRSQSPQANTERTMNFYPEIVAGGPSDLALYPTPGQSTWATLTKAGARGAWSGAGRAFVLVSDTLVEVFADASSTVRGTVSVDANPATIYDNGTAGHLFITSGGNGYCYVLATNTLTQVLTNEATMGGMLNDRFLAFNGGLGRVRLSALNDGTTWDPDLFFSRSQAPDPWKSMLINPPEIWLIGEQTGEVWYDSGAFPQPYAPIPGAFFKHGTPAPFSTNIAGEYVTWLSQTRDGAGQIVGAKGYTPQVLSDFSVDTALSVIRRTAPSGLQDCEQLVYEEDGHLFASFSFPSARATWTTDLSLGNIWHERGKWDTATGSYDVWDPRVHLYAFGKHLVGNRSSAVIAELSIAFASESDGSIIRRLRIPPPLWPDGSNRIAIDRFELLAESGQGVSGSPAQTPLVMLRTSGDARTWSSERQASAGAQGNYGKRIYWTRLGSAEKLWVPELVVSDPVLWRFTGAMVEGTGFRASSPRAAA